MSLVSKISGTRRLMNAAVAVGLAVLITPALAGCLPLPPTARPAPTVVTSAPDAGSESGSTDSGAGTPSQTDSPDLGIGGVTSGSLPSGFPAEIPVVDGKIEAGTQTSQDGKSLWSVVISVPSKAGVIDQITAAMTAAGLNTVYSSSTEGAEGGMFDNAGYTVIVALSKNPLAENFIASYIVTQK
jgi:hypothetical protein